MIQKFLEIKIETNGQNLINISQEIEKFVENSGIKFGILNLSILHTSASLIIQENVSKDVLIDLENFFNKLVPMNENLYSHILEGKDDMPAHIKSALTNNQITLSIKNKELLLGTWQGLYLFDHRLESQKRSIMHHFLGE